MALIYCSECGREISEKGEACIHCDCPLTVTLEKAYKITKCPECGTKRKPGDTKCFCGLIYENYEDNIARKRAAEIAKKRSTKTGLTGFAEKNWGQILNIIY
ncbi:MAG: hypothetical protein MUO68_07960 [Desulfobacteraceae bacterium]|nr:hypothetical protein [Desulfobacteraceae bacterium]